MDFKCEGKWILEGMIFFKFWQNENVGNKFLFIFNVFFRVEVDSGVVFISAVSRIESLLFLFANSRWGPNLFNNWSDHRRFIILVFYAMCAGLLFCHLFIWRGFLPVQVLFPPARSKRTDNNDSSLLQTNFLQCSTRRERILSSLAHIPAEK